MFGFSIQKLLFTVAIVMAVWYGFKWLGRMKIVREKERARLRREGRNNATARSRTSSDGGSGGDPDGAEEMAECDACGAFVAVRGSRSCGRDDCPYPG
jgi:uncharacterized protein